MSAEDKLALYAVRLAKEVTRLQKRVVNQRSRIKELEAELRREQSKSYRLDSQLVAYRNREMLLKMGAEGPPKFDGWMTAEEESAVKAVVGEIKR